VSKSETEAVLSTLIHADSKEGKTTVASTSPTPHLVLDAEGSWKFIDEVGYRSGKRLSKLAWNPLTEPVPRQTDGDWNLVRVNVHSWDVLAATYRWLSQAEHDFVSVTLDSITEAQRRCKKNIRTGTEQMQTQQWGQLLDQMDGLIRGFRDLTLLPNPIRVVNFISETVMKDGKWRPYMQGQIRDTIPYFVDICGYLFTELRPNGDKQDKVKRLLIGAGVNPGYLAGERVQGRLPDIIDNPSIADMLAKVYPDFKESE
jgi:hypothetical protein